MLWAWGRILPGSWFVLLPSRRCRLQVACPGGMQLQTHPGGRQGGGTGEMGRSEHPEPRPAGMRGAAAMWGWSLGPREWGVALGTHYQSLALQPQTHCSIPVRRCWPGLIAPGHRSRAPAGSGCARGRAAGTGAGQRSVCRRDTGAARGGFADTGFAAAGGRVAPARGAPRFWGRKSLHPTAWCCRMGLEGLKK